jgi:hypothetical protein
MYCNEARRDVCAQERIPQHHNKSLHISQHLSSQRPPLMIVGHKEKSQFYCTDKSVRMDHFVSYSGSILPESDVDDSGWVILEEGSTVGGAVLYTDRKTGQVVCLSTRACYDENRWNEMPPVSQFSSLLVLDLHKSVYISTLSDTVGALNSLKRMILTGCKNLQTLPPTIGNLTQLVEVSEGIHRGC